MKTYGYVRVSTSEQNVDRQVIALTKEGVKKENIYIDHISGYTFDRPSYQSLKRKLRRGDLLMVMSLDRLGRNYEEILKEWRMIHSDLGVDICILDMPILDTRKRENLLGSLISDIILQLLSYVADTERKFLLERQRTGIEAAKAKGVVFGRPIMELPTNFQTYKRMYLNNEISSRDAGKNLDVSHTTFLRWVKFSQR